MIRTAKEMIEWLQTMPDDEPILALGLWSADDVIEASVVHSEDEATPMLSREQAIKIMVNACRYGEATDENVCVLIDREVMEDTGE